MALVCFLPSALVNTPRHTFSVMPGLDPGIHDEFPRKEAIRKSDFAAQPHGWPGHARP
jgi:hypothetical protein